MVTPEQSKPDKKSVNPFEALSVGSATPLNPGGVLGKIGVLGIDQLAYATMILESMPVPLRNAAAEPYGARAAIYAVLLSQDAQMRRQQLDALRQKAEELSYRETGQLAPLIDGLRRKPGCRWSKRPFRP